MKIYRDRREGARHYVYNILDPGGPGYGKLVGIYVEGSGFTPNFHGLDVGFKPQAGIPKGTHAETLADKEDNEQ